MNYVLPFLNLFARPWMLPVALLVCALVAFVGWRTDARRRARLAQLGDLPVLERLVPRRSGGLPPRVRALLLGGAALCLGIALAGPRWGERAERRKDIGIDVALVLDVSASMLATDEGASRLDQMKADVRRLLVTMPGARVALLVVAGRSYVLTPLTADHDALELFLDGLDPGMVSQGGTAVAQGVSQATQLLGLGTDGAERALVVMTDGETWDAEEEIATAAKAARDARLAVITVAYGTEAGANIPMPGGGVKRDMDGQPVVTRSSPATLQRIATLAEGVFVDALSPDRPGRIRVALRRLRQTERVYNAGASPVQHYALFMWPAFVLLLIDALLAERARRVKVAPAVTAVLLALVAAGPPASGQVPLPGADKRPDAITLYRQRKFIESARAFQERAQEGDRSLRTLYNLGTALLEADSVTAATEVLERVVTIAPDADLRFRALFNLGLANLRRARKSSPADAGPYYASAVAAYKRALRTRTDDADAKWNLELALREQQRNGGGGGGGGGAQPPPPNPPPSKGQQELDKQRAEAVLNSAARDEREVQTRRQRDGRRREAAAGPDW
ncbi:MAG TPA: VWA domain-containing protein [Gemmatimonadaceae bacterium]|nr:VWA domain-containing protein [Gemmatimonadaceae bacterium]